MTAPERRRAVRERFRSPGAGRLAVVCLLLTVLVGEFVWYGAYPPPDPYVNLSGTLLAEGYDRFVGQRALVTASVVSTDPVVLLLDPDDTAVRLTVTGVDRPVVVGDRLRVAGVVQPGYEVRATDFIVVPRWGTTYTYVISAVAALWVLLRVVRQWRLDRRTLALVRRNRPYRLPDAVPFAGGDDDA